MVKDLDSDYWFCYTNNCHDRFLPDHGVFDLISDSEWEQKAPKEIQELALKQPEEGRYSFEIGAVRIDLECGMILNIMLDGGLESSRTVPFEVKRDISRAVANTISNDLGFDVYDEHEPLQEYAVFIPYDKWDDFAKYTLDRLEKNIDVYYRLYEKYIADYNRKPSLKSLAAAKG